MKGLKRGTDIAKITRKELKTGQKRTRDEKSTQELDVSQQKSTKCKRSTRLQESGNATLAIRVPLFHPTANIQDPMIKRDQWPRLEAAKERVKDLEASSLAYKRSSPLTHRDI
ncbi:hypothetical protein Tco_0231235 [Tanacetum coccineum]